MPLPERGDDNTDMEAYAFEGHSSASVATGPMVLESASTITLVLPPETSKSHGMAMINQGIGHPNQAQPASPPGVAKLPVFGGAQHKAFIETSHLVE
jgi:hypothetical protein